MVEGRDARSSVRLSCSSREELHSRVHALGAATEGENLLHQGLGTLAGLQHFVEMAPGWAGGRHILQRQLRITNNRRQNIIKIVRHPAGQPAYGLHFLRLTQLLR